MPDLEKDVDSVFGKKSSGGEGFTLATLLSGIFISSWMDGYVSKIFGASLIAAGVGILWVDGYSPIKITKELIESTGKLVCLPYDYIKKKYKRKESGSTNSKVDKS